MDEIGKTLQDARISNGLTLEEAGEDLQIKPVILDNIESGNTGCFRDIYVLKEYILNYAKYLGLDANKLETEFNEYLFNYTSKIPVKEIEKKIEEKQEELAKTSEVRIASPYTDETHKYKSKSYVFLYVLVAFLVALAIFWSVKQITIGGSVARITNSIK